MRTKILIIIVIILSIILFIVPACNNKIKKNDDNFLISKIKQSLKDSTWTSIPKYEQIVHFEIIDKGILIFSKNNSKLNMDFIKTTTKDWEYIPISEVPLKSDGAYSWVMSNEDYKEIFLFSTVHGVINNSKINELKVKVGDSKNFNSAKIIKLEDGLKIWFVLYDHPLKGVVIIRGLSDEGKIID